MARAAEAVWQLAHDLHADESLGEGGVLDRVFEQLQHQQRFASRSKPSPRQHLVKVHPDGTGALKKTDRKRSASPAADGPPRFIWLPRMLERL